MRIRVWVDKVLALKAGRDECGYVLVDVPAAELTEDERLTLLKHQERQKAGEPVGDFRLKHREHYQMGQATKEEVKRALAALADADRARLEEADRLERGGVELLKWAELYGSELLRARVDGGYEWVKLARQEYADRAVAPLKAHYRPSEERERVQVKERPTPDLAEIRALEQARTLLEGRREGPVADRVGELPPPLPPLVTADVSLKWVEITHDGFTRDVTVARPELLISVTCPDGKVVERRFIIQKEGG
jgi:hypothetical protein